MTPWFQTSGLQNHEKTNFCCKASSLQKFVIAALGVKYTKWYVFVENADQPQRRKVTVWPHSGVIWNTVPTLGLRLDFKSFHPTLPYAGAVIDLTNTPCLTFWLFPVFNCCKHHCRSLGWWQLRGWGWGGQGRALTAWSRVSLPELSEGPVTGRGLRPSLWAQGPALKPTAALFHFLNEEYLEKIYDSTEKGQRAFLTFHSEKDRWWGNVDLRLYSGVAWGKHRVEAACCFCPTLRSAKVNRSISCLKYTPSQRGNRWDEFGATTQCPIGKHKRYICKQEKTPFCVALDLVTVTSITVFPYFHLRGGWPKLEARTTNGPVFGKKQPESKILMLATVVKQEDEPQTHHAKWNKPVSGQLSYDSTYSRYLEQSDS